MPCFTVLELFHGIGGLREGLHRAAEKFPGQVSLDVKAAVDISSLCAETYRLNFPESTLYQKDVKTLPDAFFSELNADLWVMSPPCQPYTQRGKELDVEDPRAEALQRLVKYLRCAPTEALPKGILLENVPAFAESRSLLALEDALRGRCYAISEQELCPTQFQIPNRRRRFYLVAVRDHGGGSPGQWKPTTTVDPSARASVLSEFLGGDPASRFFDEDFRLPTHYTRLFAALDIVEPESTTSDCFTGAYGRYAKGSGSVLQCGDFGYRLFSAEEIVRLHDFSNSFRFPERLPQIKRYQLIGNSVNVRVVEHLSGLLLEATAAVSQGGRTSNVLQ